MLKYKAELIIVIILIPILTYVAWQAYNSYIRPPSMDIEELQETSGEVKTESVIKPSVLPTPPAPKGTLLYTGYTERDPLKTSMPIKEKIEKPKVSELPPGKIPQPVLIEEPKPIPPKEIIPPTFTITGIVWGTSPRAIIDNKVHKIGDIVKGAKILNITSKGVQMVYEGKEFCVTIKSGV